MSDLVAAIGLRFAAGDDLTLRFIVADPNGDPLDITGMTVTFLVARRRLAEPVISTDDGTATVALSAPEAGVFDVSVASAVTEPLEGTFRFQATITDLAGKRSTVAWGFLTFAPGLVTPSTA